MNETTEVKETKACVESLIRKAEQAESPDHALKFSQAACNASNAMCGLNSLKNA